MLRLKNNEEAFKLIPIGIRYKCEVCHDGEMIATNNDPMIFDANTQMMHLRTHKCNKCGMELKLPKTYPYIEWIPENEINERGGLDDYIESAKVPMDNTEC